MFLGSGVMPGVLLRGRLVLGLLVGRLCLSGRAIVRVPGRVIDMRLWLTELEMPGLTRLSWLWCLIRRLLIFRLLVLGPLVLGLLIRGRRLGRRCTPVP